MAGLAAFTAGVGTAHAAALPADVAAAIRKDYGSPGAETRYRDGTVDLDGDGKPELLVYVLGMMACGTGGCPTLVFTPVGQGYRLVSTIPVSRPPIRVGRERRHGWRDLILEVSGGGTKARTVALRFDGERYPSNPTVPGPSVLPGKVEGAEVVITDVASFEEATLLPPAGVPAGAAAAAKPAGSGPSFDHAKASTAVELACRDHADTPVSVVFHDETDPKSAVVTVGDRRTIAWIAPSASGARYTNDEVELWEHQGETTITWSGTRYVCRPR